MVRAVQTAPEREVVQVRFRPFLTHVSRARTATFEYLARRELDADRIDDAVTVVSELATNAVIHAGGDFDVSVTHTGFSVEIACRDSAWLRWPHMRRPDAESTVGRGMQIVDALASAWGVSIDKTARTKTVWVRVGNPGAEAVGQPPPSIPIGPHRARSSANT